MRFRYEAELRFGDAAFGVLLRARLAVILPVRIWSLRWAALLVALFAACLWLGLAAAQMAGAMNAQVLMETVTATLFGGASQTNALSLMAVELAALPLLFLSVYLTLAGAGPRGLAIPPRRPIRPSCSGPAAPWSSDWPLPVPSPPATRPA